jgi:hypothetical protein
MEVFNQYYKNAVSERYAQIIELFNAASKNTIILSGQLQDGDYVQNSFYKILSASRRVDRYATNTSAATVNLSQDKEVSVKVAGGFGPVEFNAGDMGWLNNPSAEAIEQISSQFAEALMADQLNTVVMSGVAAISNVAGATNDVTSTSGTLTQPVLNDTHALFGDASQSLTAQIMTGGAYHDLVGVALANQAQLFTAGNVTVIDILGKATVISDIPALTVAGSPGTHKVLTLTQAALTVGGGDDVVSNIETSNGNQQISTTFQSDYSFIVGVKGYAWDIANGGKSPLDAELATGSNWDQVATSIKHTAGVITIADRG